MSHRPQAAGEGMHSWPERVAGSAGDLPKPGDPPGPQRTLTSKVHLTSLAEPGAKSG